ncbi:MAG: cytochrome c oxidase subunit II [Vicinamibacterales bacterium]
MVEKILYLPAQASAHANDLDLINLYVHILMVVLFLGWSIYFVIVLIRFRASKNPVANPEGVKNHASTYVEAGVVVAEAVLLLGFSIPLWAARVNQFPSEEEATVVRVVGQQFAWNIHYSGPDGKFGRSDAKLVDPQGNPIGLDRSDTAGGDDIVTVNQLHLPVGKPAIIYVSSMDVIHSFGIQEMRVKQDAIPGMSTPLWFTPTVTSEEMKKRKGDDTWSYEINCAQLCGLGHYRMKGFVTIDTPEQYQAWLDEQGKAQTGEGEDAGWG